MKLGPDKQSCLCVVLMQASVVYHSKLRLVILDGQTVGFSKHSPHDIILQANRLHSKTSRMILKSQIVGGLTHMTNPVTQMTGFHWLNQLS